MDILGFLHYLVYYTLYINIYTYPKDGRLQEQAEGRRKVSTKTPSPGRQVLYARRRWKVCTLVSGDIGLCEPAGALTCVQEAE